MTQLPTPLLRGATHLVFLLALASCSVVGPKIDFYDPSLAQNDASAASVVGSRSIGQKPLSPVLVYVGNIDGKTIGKVKKARCNFDSPYPITPGPHDLLVVISAGEMFSTSRFGYTKLHIETPPGSRLTIQGEVLSAESASLWVTTEAGKVVLDKTTVVLKDSPSKGMPLGFAVMEDSCAIP